MPYHLGMVPELEVILVRHSEAVLPGVGDHTEDGRPLTATGERQARDITARLVAIAPRAILSSPYKRAVQTVQETAIRLGLEIRLLNDLREWHSGLRPEDDWEPHYLHCWNNPHFALPGGETQHDTRARAVAVLDHIRDAYRSTAGTLVLASHGTWITLALDSIGTHVDYSFWRSMPMPAVYRLILEPSGQWWAIAGPGIPNYSDKDRQP